MAIVDGDRDEIVIRILYDGPPRAGKTTSLKALMGMLAARRRSDIFTPAEAEGRTLYFDWMDYLGGWFDGNQVRCQIVAAPGQRSLAKRRQGLLQDADVVVLVLESGPAGVEAGREYLAELDRSLPGQGEIPVPVVIQANKKDLPGALSEEDVREHFVGHKHLAILSASASEGAGVREVFTFAVRLALDRVRALQKENALRIGVPKVRSGEDLLAWIERYEADAPVTDRIPVAAGSCQVEPSLPSADPAFGLGLGQAPEFIPATGLAPAESSERLAAAELPPDTVSPALPTSRVESGLVWPPMTGRLLLHESERASPAIRRMSDGSWLSDNESPWSFHSAADQVYTNLETGRSALLREARAHAPLASLLSDDNALVLADSGDKRWRLWKISRREPSLLDRLTPLLEHIDAAGAEKIFRLADALIRADTRFRAANAPFRATLSTIGICSGVPCHIGGLRDEPEAVSSTLEEDPDALVRREFGPYLAQASQAGAIDALAAVAKMREFLSTHPDRLDVIESMAAMLIGD